VLNDMSGVYSDDQGPGSTIAAQMAVEDFGGTVAGIRCLLPRRNSLLPKLHLPSRRLAVSRHHV
jgi:hypothetical protein